MLPSYNEPDVKILVFVSCQYSVGESLILFCLQKQDVQKMCEAAPELGNLHKLIFTSLFNHRTFVAYLHQCFYLVQPKNITFSSQNRTEGYPGR